MKKVLIIDDNEDLCTTVSDILEDAGYGVAVAHDPVEAKELLNGGKFQLILCDLMMPYHDDPELDELGGSVMVGVHAIRQFSKAYPQTPIVAISGEMTGQALDAIGTFGAADTLAKPFGRAQLLKTVERLV